MTKNKVGKILIVDDEVELKNILVEALDSAGYEATGRTSAEEALSLLRDEPFDILLTDLMMPGMDGIELVREGRQIDPNLICIMMTGQGTIQTAVDAMKGGTFDYVLKPFRLQTMLPMLTRAMNTRHLHLENVHLRSAVAIHELGQTIAFTLNPKTILSKLADAALLQSEADEVSVLLPIDGTEQFYVAAVRGEKHERLLGERVPYADSISSWVARQHEPLILNGEVDDDRFVARWPRPDIRSSVSIPMLVAQKLIGVLNVNVINKARPFTLGQMKALTILAGIAAAALEGASLYSKVQDAERNYRSIFENAAEGICRTTVDGRFITANPAMASIFGYDSPEELVAGVDNIERELCVDEGSRDEFKRLLYSEGKVIGFESRYRRKDGQVIVLSQSARAARDEKGNLLYFDGVAQDITERKRAEEALRTSEAEMRALFAAMRDVILVLDINGRYVKIAPTEGSDLYIPPEMLLGKTMHEVFSQEEADFFLGHVREALSQHKTHRVEYKLTLENREVWFEGTVSPMTEDSVIWVARDVTERKRALEQLEESELRFRQLAENINEVFWIADPAAGDILYVSPAYEQIWNRPTNEVYANPAGFLNAINPDDQPAIISGKKKLLLGESSRDDYRIRRPDGTERWISDRAFPIKDKDGNVTRIVGIAEDITERKVAEANLRESEQRYRDVIENAHDIIYSHDLKGRYIAMNQAGGEITGYTVEEALKRTMSDTVAPESLAKATEMTQRKLAGENVTAYEMEIIARDGRRIPVEVNTWLMYENGAPVGVTGIARDITQRREAEAEMRFQRSLLEAQNEASIDGILAVSPEGEVLSYNRKFLELWRLAENQLAETTDRRALKAAMDQLVNPEEFLDRVQYLYDHPDETSQEEIQLKDGRVLDCHSAPVLGPSGEYYGRVWYFHDITDRKKAQAELSRLAAAVQQTADSILITDPDGTIEYVNPAFESITGYSAIEALGQNPRLMKSGKNHPSVYHDLWQTITRGDVWEGQLINKRKDGSLFHEQATISAVRDHAGEIVNYVAVKKDISHLIQLEDQLRQSQKMEAIGQLAGGVAHDFNNLLTAINGYSSLALQRIEENHPLKGFLEEIKKAGDRAANLTRQLLAFGRKQILMPVPLDLNDVVSDMNKMLRRLIGEDIELISKFETALPNIKADAGQIEQVLVNLVVNARDAMPTGGALTIETAGVELDEGYAARRVGVRAGKYVMLAVSDTGTGMSEETRARIFDPFFTTKEKGKGTGLGLSTVYGIVKQSGGNIWVYSEPNCGTTFKVYLPQIESAVTAAEKPIIDVYIPTGSETILLVEDEDVVRGLAHHILARAGYTVIEAARGDEAIRLGTEAGNSIDLLLTDVVMPQMSGKDVADGLAGVCPKMKVLFMSGYTDEAIVQHGVLDPNVEFIQKPFTPLALSKKVRAVLDQVSNVEEQVTEEVSVLT